MTRGAPAHARPGTGGWKDIEFHRPSLWVRFGATAVAVVAVVALVWHIEAGSAAPGAGLPTPAGAGSGASSAARQPNLTVPQMAGQRVVYSYTGLQPPSSLLSWIRHGEAAGVIFFHDNIASDAQISGVISELDRANASPDNPLRALPLLLMTDQEGGEVRRLAGAPVLSEKQVGESAHPEAQAADAGTGAGRNLADVGMDVNLAPVLDVFRAAGDFDDQFGRSYSSNPVTASRLGAKFVAAQQATGVAATVKHFPGLGAAATSQDTDLMPVTLSVPLRQLRDTDEYPYKAAIAAGVKLVMVSWAVYPALDPRRPAGLSSIVVSTELRKQLGFHGVTVTDALEAGALKAFGTIPHRATLAAGAGMDLLLCSVGRPNEGREARTALVDGYQDGTLGKAAFSASLARVLALRTSLAAEADLRATARSAVRARNR